MLTYEEAYKILTEHTRNYVGLKDAEALEVAIGAVEKQIQKSAIGNRYPWGICPSCGGSVYVKHIQEHIQNEENTHCEHCGQALDWSDTK